MLGVATVLLFCTAGMSVHCRVVEPGAAAPYLLARCGQHLPVPGTSAIETQSAA